MVRMLRPMVQVLDTRIARPPPKQVDPHYSSQEHRRWRAIVIARSGGRCQDPACKAPTRPGRLYADHVVELKDGGAAFDLSNGVARCGSCHVRKGHAERAKRMAR
ncbi:MAG: HNH endonuclease [Rhodospirillales bacterium]|nr:HNH endonuclease [Rhodospirillales bacterium]